jgi:hypothetical protein
MNILKYSISLAILLKCVIASERDVNEDVVKALEQPGFEGIKNDWRKWKDRKDLFDYVVTKSVVFITGFINQVEDAKTRTLAALFIERSDEVDQVLEKIEYNDYDLWNLTDYRPELAESHEKFFMVIDLIKKPEDQEEAVKSGVINLFIVEKHDSVIPLINALEKRQFDGRNLQDAAILQAFYSGAYRGINEMVEEFHEHHAITSEKYAYRLIESWENAKSKTFQFLLAHADQGDLEKAKKDDKYKEDQEFRNTVDGAFSNAKPAGARHSRPKRRVELVKKTFSETAGIESLAQEKGPGDIILGYLCGSEGTEGGKGQ